MALRGVSQPSSTEAKDITVGTTTVTGGTDGGVLYDNAGVLGEKTVTGTGSVVLATSPTLVSPLLGTPTSGVATNLTGTAAGLTAGTVTTNANLTGDVTSVGNATTLTNPPVIAKVLTGYTSGAGTVASTDSILQAIQKLNGNDATNANLTGPITSVGNATSIASQTGTGTKFVVDTSPTLVTPTLGVATATSINGQTITSGSGTLTLGSNTIAFNAASTYTPTLSAGLGTITTSTAAGRYKQFGKYLWLQVKITISNSGTATGALNFNLPNSLTAADDMFMGGFDSGASVGAFATVVSGNTNFSASRTAGVTLIVNGANIIFTGVVEVQ